MNDLEAKLHRTWVQLLVEIHHRDLAAAVMDGDLELISSGYSYVGLSIDIPSSAYGFIVNEPSFKQVLEDSLKLVARGHLTDQNGNDIGEAQIDFRIKLLDVDDDWKSVIRNLIVNSKDANQGGVSSLMFAKQGKALYTYNEMKFASQSEIRIAQELENRQVLFFPLPLAVRAETGTLYQDHREPDFLVCDNGVWGILEVSYHPDRFEKDAEKDSWFKKSGILCVQHCTAERCYHQPGDVVDEFLMILAKHKR